MGEKVSRKNVKCQEGMRCGSPSPDPLSHLPKYKNKQHHIRAQRLQRQNICWSILQIFSFPVSTSPFLSLILQNTETHIHTYSIVDV